MGKNNKHYCCDCKYFVINSIYMYSFKCKKYNVLKLRGASICNFFVYKNNKKIKAEQERYK